MAVVPDGPCPVRWAGRQAVVTLPEHIGAADSGPIREQLLDLINRGTAVLIADMTGTVLCEPGGADALLRACQRPSVSGGQLRVAVTAPAVRRILDASGLDRLVPVYPSVPAAIAGGMPADRESGLSARTIARRLSSVSGLYAYLVARGDTPVQANPVPRGLLTRRQGGAVADRAAGAGAAHAAADLAAGRGRPAGRRAAHPRDRAMVLAMLLAGLRRCEVLGLRFCDVQVADRRLVVVEGKGGHHRVVPAANRFFDALGAYLHEERPATARTDRVFVVLKGPRRGLPLTAEGLDEVLAGAAGWLAWSTPPVMSCGTRA